MKTWLGNFQNILKKSKKLWKIWKMWLFKKKNSKTWRWKIPGWGNNYPSWSTKMWRKKKRRNHNLRDPSGIGWKLVASGIGWKSVLCGSWISLVLGMVAGIFLPLLSCSSFMWATAVCNFSVAVSWVRCFFRRSWIPEMKYYCYNCASQKWDKSIVPLTLFGWQ